MSATRLQQVLLAGEQARSKHVTTGGRLAQMVVDAANHPIPQPGSRRKVVQLLRVTTDVGSDGHIGSLVVDIADDHYLWDQPANRSALLGAIQEQCERAGLLQEGMEVGSIFDASTGEMTGAFMRVVSDPRHQPRIEWSGDLAAQATMYKLWNATFELGPFTFFVGPNVSGFRRLEHVRNGFQEGSRYVHTES